MSSTKDTFEPNTFAANTFAAGAFRGTGVDVANYDVTEAGSISCRSRHGHLPLRDRHQQVKDR